MIGGIEDGIAVALRHERHRKKIVVSKAISQRHFNVAGISLRTVALDGFETDRVFFNTGTFPNHIVKALSPAVDMIVPLVPGKHVQQIIINIDSVADPVCASSDHCAVIFVAGLQISLRRIASQHHV